MKAMPAVTRLAAGQENVVWRTTTAADAAAVRLPLDLEPGTYLAGQAQDGAKTLILDLIDKDGRLLRRVISPENDRKTFNLLVPEKGAFLSARSSSGTTDFTIAVTQNVLPSATPPAETPPPLLSPRLSALAGALADGDTTETFWAAIAAEGTPLVEPGPDGQFIVTFLYRGARTGVRILGAPSSDHDPMLRLAQSDVWYRSYRLPADTRLSYRLAPDVPKVPGSFWQKRTAILATAQTDPFNKHPWPTRCCRHLQQEIGSGTAPSARTAVCRRAPGYQQRPGRTVHLYQRTPRQLSNDYSLTGRRTSIRTIPTLCCW